MKERYSVEEILNAIDDLQNIKKERKKIDPVILNKPSTKNKSEIPTNTLKLIEEAEKIIKLK